MNLTVTSINIRYDHNQVSGVQVYFSGYDTDQSTSLGGHITLTADEYKGNESLDRLNELARERIRMKLTE